MDAHTLLLTFRKLVIQRWDVSEKNLASHDYATEVAEAWSLFPSVFQITHQCIWLFITEECPWEYCKPNSNKDTISQGGRFFFKGSLKSDFHSYINNLNTLKPTWPFLTFWYMIKCYLSWAKSHVFLNRMPITSTYVTITLLCFIDDLICPLHETYFSN